MPILSRQERETIIRWDDSLKTIDIYTASPVVARQLIKRGYPMVPDKPWGWRARSVPRKALSFRRLDSVTKMERAAKGRGFPNTGRKMPTAAPNHEPSRDLSRQNPQDEV